MAWRMMTVVAAAALLAACGSTEGSGKRPGGSASTTTVPGPNYPSGTEFGDGFVVPENTELVGSSFVTVAYDEDGTRAAVEGSSSAYLVVTGNGFAAFDDLASQVRSLHPTAAMPGTADSCIWSIDESQSGTIKGPQGLLTTADPPPDGITGVTCTAWASGSEGRRYFLSLWAYDGVPIVLELSSSTVPPGEGAADSYAKQILKEGQSGDVDPLTELGPSSAPSGAWDLLDVKPFEPPATPVGEPFGPAANCTATGAPFTLPEGAEVLVENYGDDLTSLLAVDDASAAMTSLRAQVGEDDPNVRADLATIELEDGGTVLRYDSAVMAGGGACSITSSTDGRTLRIDRYPD